MNTPKEQLVSTPGKIIGEMTLTVSDSKGRLKRLWNENWLGRFIRVHFGRDLQGYRLLGTWNTQMQFKNLVVTVGKAGVASRINGAGAEAAFTYLAVGTGTTSPIAANTILETEITDSGLARASATATRSTTTVANDTSQLDKTWSVSGTKAITEGGAFNASSAGVLLGRQTFSAVNVVNGDSFTLTYKFAVS